MGAQLCEHIHYHDRRASEEHAQEARASCTQAKRIHADLAQLHEARKADLLFLVPYEIPVTDL